jgi:serine/threonine-protein kinase
VLHLVTFGGVALRPVAGDRAGENIPLSRQGLALLVLLAAGPDAGVSRDSLVACLWPESDEERARNALRQALFALRRDLALPNLLLGGSDLVLNPAVVTSDVREFEHCRTAGHLERVAELYAGPFLEGFHLPGASEFEHWVDRQRAEYGARVKAALEALARRATARGDHPAAVEWWRRLVALDPLNTGFVQESMTAQAAAGNTAGALRQAQLHEHLLRQELGAAAGPGFAELVGRLRRGEPVAAPLPAPPVPPPSTPASPGPRERFMDRLARDLADRFELEEARESRTEGAVRLIPARDRRHDRRVILKVIHPALASQIDVERFVREIRLTAKLLHPNILPLLDSGEVAGRPWFATPALEGETLRARLSREQTIPPDEAIRLALDLADALGYAHGRGIVHRDVTPENVVLAGGHALLTNLGVARALDTAAGGTLTDTGALVGSLAYMSPEQSEGSRHLDARSDVYALGAVLFEAVTGEPLFSGPSAQAILAKRSAEPTPGPDRLAGVPTPLAAVIRRALASDRNDRYPSMGELRAALEGTSTAGPSARWSWRSLRSWFRPPG